MEPNIWTVIGGLIIIVAAIVLLSKRGKKPTQNTGPESRQTPLPVRASNRRPQPRIGRWLYMDDAVRSMTADLGGDYNHPFDLAFVLASAMQNESRPMAIGATCVGNGAGVSASVPKQLVQASRLEVPVLTGNGFYAPDRSELAEFIVDESRKGILNVCIGGPCNDLADAVRLGARVNNIRVWAILRNTWNEWTDSRTKDLTVRATNLVYNSINNIEDIRAYRKFLRCPHGSQWADQWIKEMRKKSDLCNIAFGEFAAQMNRNMNTAQSNGPNALRIADFMTAEAYFGLNFTKFDNVIARFERGIHLMNEL